MLNGGLLGATGISYWCKLRFISSKKRETTIFSFIHCRRALNRESEIISYKNYSVQPLPAPLTLAFAVANDVSCSLGKHGRSWNSFSELQNFDFNRKRKKQSNSYLRLTWIQSKPGLKPLFPPEGKLWFLSSMLANHVEIIWAVDRLQSHVQIEHF